MHNLIIFCLVILLQYIYSQKNYTKERLIINNIKKLDKENDYFFAVLFDEYQKGNKLHFFFRISNISYLISNIKYGFTSSTSEPKDLDIPTKTFEIKNYTKKIPIESDISLYFDIEIPLNESIKQIIILLNEINSSGYMMYNEFDESDYKIINHFEENTFLIKDKPLFIIANVSNIDNYYVKLTSSSHNYLNVSYKDSIENISDFIIFPKDLLDLNAFKITLNNENNYYQNMNITIENTNIIYFIIKSNYSNNNEEIKIKFTENYDLGYGIIHLKKGLRKEIISKGKINIIQYEINHNTYLYDYYMLKFKKKEEIKEIYYSNTNNNFTTEEHNMTAEIFTCSENEHYEIIYKRCKMPKSKSNSKSVILIIYSKEKTNFTIYQKTYNDTIFESMPTYSISKNYSFEDRYDYHVLTIGNINYDEVFYLKFYFNDYDSRKEFLISTNNNDLKEYYESPLVKKIDNDAFIRLGNKIMAYYHSKNQNFTSGIQSIYLSFRMDKGNSVIIQSNYFNEHSFKNYTFSKNESVEIKNHDGLNTYIAFNISHLKINETFYMKFKGLTNAFNSTKIYYYFDILEITFDNFNLEYEISENCISQNKSKETTIYCNYSKSYEYDKSLRLIILLNPGSDLVITNTEKYEYKEEKGIIGTIIVLLILFSMIAFSLISFKYNKNQKRNYLNHIEETGKLID